MDAESPQKVIAPRRGGLRVGLVVLALLALMLAALVGSAWWAARVGFRVVAVSCAQLDCQGHEGRAAG
jgi:hypothetical protein